MKPPLRTVICLFLLLLIGTAVYLPAFRASFHLDDGPSIRDNAAIRHLDLGAVWRFWPTRFFTYLTLAINFRLAALDPLPYHAANIAVHFLNTIMVYFLARRLLRRGTNLIPSIVSLLFLCHPLQTQAVTYVIQRATSLAACFFLLSVLFYLKSRTGRTLTNLSTYQLINYFLSLLFCGCAVLTKEFTVSLPVILLLLEFVVLKDSPLTTRKKLLRLLPFFSVILLLPAIVYLSRANPSYNDSGQIEWLKTAGVVDGLAEGHGKLPLEYLITQPRVFLTYLRLLFLPVRQRVEYDENAHYTFSSFLEPSVLLPLLPIAGLFILALARIRKNPVVSFGLLWFIIVLLPESSVIPILDVAVEHRLYLPLIGPLLAFGTFLGSLTSHRKARLLLTAAIAASFCLLTYHRNLVWRDPVTLWEDNVKKAEGKARVHGNLGKAYLDRGRYERAAAEFKRLIEIDPTFASAYNNLAVIYIDHLKDYREAEKYISASLAIYPDYPAGYLNRGVIYLNQRRLRPAIENFRKVVELDPKNLLAHYNLGACYINLGDLYRGEAESLRAIGKESKAAEKKKTAFEEYRKAEEFLRRGLASWPEDYRFYLLLARAYQSRGRDKEAEIYFQKAQSLQPTDR